MMPAPRFAWPSDVYEIGSATWAATALPPVNHAEAVMAARVYSPWRFERSFAQREKRIGYRERASPCAISFSWDSAPVQLSYSNILTYSILRHPARGGERTARTPFVVVAAPRLYSRTLADFSTFSFLGEVRRILPKIVADTGRKRSAGKSREDFSARL